MADDEDDDGEEVSPFGNWTIKKVPKETRDLALKCARKRGERMAEWFVRAVANQANTEAGDAVFQPGQQRPTDVVAPRANSAPERANLTPEDLSRLMQAAASLASATGVKPAVRDIRRAYAAMDELVREGRGMAPRPVKSRRAKAVDADRGIEPPAPANAQRMAVSAPQPPNA
jgi:hypothetical protein